MRTLISATIVLLAMAGGLRAADQEAAQKLYEQVTPSLVAVQYTYDGEYGRREFVGTGLVVGEEGMVVTSISLFPMSMPDDQMKDFKVILPGDDEKELDAVFVGRDERTDLAFVRTKEKQKWPTVKFEDTPVKIGQTVTSVGLLGKDAGYKAYYAEAFVSAMLRGPVPQALVSPDGLAGVGAPVFVDGKAIGLVLSQAGQSVVLSGDGRNSMAAVATPPRLFVPAKDFLSSLANPPKEGKALVLPWIGAPLSGLKKEVAERFNVKGQPVVLVGDVIAKSPAEKGGLKAGDLVTKVNGEMLERGDEPAEVPQILMRKIRRMGVGDKVKFTVLRGMDKDKPPVDVTVTLEEQPKQAHQVQRYLAEDLGFSVREIVFADTYSKKLPAEQPGVSVAFVRPNGPAATARLAPGDLITKANSTPVKDLEQFKKLYQQTRADAEKAKEALVLEVVRERGNTQVIRIEPPQ